MAKKEVVGKIAKDGIKEVLAVAAGLGTGFVTMTACSTLAPVVPATKVAQAAFKIGSYGFSSVTSTTAYALTKDELDTVENEIKRRVNIHRLKMSEKTETKEK